MHDGPVEEAPQPHTRVYTEGCGQESKVKDDLFPVVAFDHFDRGAGQWRKDPGGGNEPVATPGHSRDVREVGESVLSGRRGVLGLFRKN